MGEQSHQSDPRVLNRRTLERDHRRLAALLGPGMSVLDVGCGTGAITAGIARRVGARGRVVGMDRDPSLIGIAGQSHTGLANLEFRGLDIFDLNANAEYDVVNAARTLQWVRDPLLAVRRMKQAAKPGGWVVVLDYNHAENAWQPEPPPAFTDFYRAFLEWREANGWDNRIGNRLGELLAGAGLVKVETFNEDEVASCGTADFDGAVAVWLHVVQTLGHAMVEAGFLTESQREDAEERYSGWVGSSLERQKLSLVAAIARVD